MPTVSLPSSPRNLPVLRRLRPRRASSAPMPPDTPEALEAALVRRSVGALSAGVHTCRHCRRSPLIGERVSLYAIGSRTEEIVCELCRPLRRAAPDRSLLVRSTEQGSVRACTART